MKVHQVEVRVVQHAWSVRGGNDEENTPILAHRIKDVFMSSIC